MDSLPRRRTWSSGAAVASPILLGGRNALIVGSVLACLREGKGRGAIEEQACDDVVLGSAGTSGVDKPTEDRQRRDSNRCEPQRRSADGRALSYNKVAN